MYQTCTLSFHALDNCLLPVQKFLHLIFSLLKFKYTICNVLKFNVFKSTPLLHTKYSPVIEEQLLSRLDWSLSKDADSVVAVDHHHFGVAVRVDRMVRKTNLVAFSSGIHDKVYNIYIGNFLSIRAN